MDKQRLYIFLLCSALLTGATLLFAAWQKPDDRFTSYVADPKKQEIKMYWKDDEGIPFKNIGNLRSSLGKQDVLAFAMNAGMFETDNSPVGLFIQDKKTLTPLNTRNADGNFYLKPNGVFYITTGNKAVICKTEDFRDDGKVKFATQSGPMLLVDGKIHPSFTEGSTNVNIRNGVGILPGNKVVFVLSKEKVNFYDFANYFKQLGCINALYFDGFVSKMYLPEKGIEQLDGNLGVMIGILKHPVR